MARVKRGTVSRRKHKKLLAKVKGFRGTKSKLIRTAKQAALHAGAYAFHGRKLRKRNMRSLWITRIGEAAKQEGISYSVFINRLKKSNISLDRKILSDMVVNDMNTFRKLIENVKNN